MSDLAFSILDYGFRIAFALALLALPFFVVGGLKHHFKARANPSEPKPIKAVLFFVVPLVAALLFGAINDALAQSRVLAFLSSLPPDRVVLVNGRAAVNPDAIIAALQSVGPVLAHHSHPTTRISVEIKSLKGALALTLQRDSGLAQEYWVFFGQSRGFSGYEAGRITTEIFDAY